MIYLDNNTRKIQAKLDAAVATSQPQAVVYFYDITPQSKEGTGEYRGGSKYTDLSASADIDICLAPILVGTVRNVETIQLYNKDTAAVVATIKMDDGGTESILVKKTLAAGETLCYEDQGGWQVF